MQPAKSVMNFIDLQAQPIRKSVISQHLCGNLCCLRLHLLLFSTAEYAPDPAADIDKDKKNALVQTILHFSMSLFIPKFKAYFMAY